MVAFDTIACKVLVLVRRKIGLLASLVVSIGGSDHGRPGEIDAKVALHGVAEKFFAFCIDNAELDAGQRQGSVSWFGGRDARKWGDHNAACFGLPPGINNRAFALADVVVVPMPGFLVDGFADGAENFEGAKIMSFNGLGAKGLKGSNGCWGGIKYVDFVLFNNLPESSWMWIGGHPFKHQRSGASK